MATEKQIKEFIEKIAPCAIHAYKTVGKILPSVCIGMACVESAYGTAGSTKYNSFLGQKVGTGKTATKYWDGTFFTSKTKEEYTVGVHTTITDAFRSYKDIQQCVLNYYELLNTKLYARVLGNVDYKTQMTQIKACGYMTSSTEVNSVIKIIEKYHLTDYDQKAIGGIIDEALEIIGDINRNPYNEPTKAVRYNTRGNDARWLQVELNRKGYKLTVDGVAGLKTIEALKDFQKKAFPDAPAEWDGICGEKTRAALKA